MSGDDLKYFNIFWHGHKLAVRRKIRVRPATRMAGKPRLRRVNPALPHLATNKAGKTSFSYTELPRLPDSMLV